MPIDPLAETIVRPPVTPGVPPPDELAGGSESTRLHLDRERKRHDLLLASRQFARHDDVAASPFGAMRRSELMVAARIAEVPNADRFSDAELRAVLYYCDRKRVEAGAGTLAPAAIDATVQPVAEAKPAPVVVPGIPRSKSNKWRVVKGGQVAMAGGIYTVAKDTIVGLDQGLAHVQNLIDHGLALEPWPSAPASVTCATCDTTRLVASLETGEPYPEGCPMCLVLSERSAETDAADRLDRLASWAISQGAPTPTANDRGRPVWDGQPTPPDVVGPARSRYGALLGWAMRRGAPPPGPDGTWDGELCPPEPAAVESPPAAADPAPVESPAPSSTRRGKADR